MIIINGDLLGKYHWKKQYTYFGVSSRVTFNSKQLTPEDGMIRQNIYIELFIVQFISDTLPSKSPIHNNLGLQPTWKFEKLYV